MKSLFKNIPIRHFIILLCFFHSAIPLQAKENNSLNILAPSLKQIEEFKKMVVVPTSGTQSLIVWQGGKVVEEWHKNEKLRSRPQLIWSASKSVTNFLLYWAVRSKKIKLDDSVCVYSAVAKKYNKCSILVSHLADFASGIFWNETYEKEPYDSSVIAMLYLRGSKDMANFAFSHPFIAKPGAVRRYSSGDTIMLARVLKDAYGDKWESFLSEALSLFTGDEDYFLEQDETGNLVASSYMYFTPRQLLKFALLYMNPKPFPNGIDQQWLDYTFSSSMTTIADKWEDAGLHKQWRKNEGLTPEGKIENPIPELPSDTIWASGHWGQKIIIIPSAKLIIIRIGNDRDVEFDFSKAFRALNLVSPKTDKVNISWKTQILPFPNNFEPYTSGWKFLSKLKIGAAFQAKLYTTCRKGIKMDKNYCHEFVQNPILPEMLMPISEKDNGEVDIGYFPYKKSAQFRGGHIGSFLLSK